MKCPKCNAEGAYQPLMREVECENSSCSLFVCPPGKMTPAESCGEFIKGKFSDFPAYDGTKPFYSYPADGDYTENIAAFKVGDRIRLKKEKVGTIGFQAEYFKEAHTVDTIKGKEFVSKTLSYKDRNGEYWLSNTLRPQEYYEKIVEAGHLSFPNKPVGLYRENWKRGGQCGEMVTVKREIADKLFLTRHDYIENRQNGVYDTTFTIKGYFDSKEQMKEAEKLIKSIAKGAL